MGFCAYFLCLKCDFEVMQEMTTGFMTLKETSSKWGISARRINTLCSEGRIPGAAKIGNMWVIPEGAEKPKDERIKTGKYIKSSNADIQ